MRWQPHCAATSEGLSVKLKGIRIGNSHRLNKDGDLVKNERRLDVSARIRQKKSKKVRVAKRGTA